MSAKRKTPISPAISLTPEQALRMALNTPLPEKEGKRQAKREARAENSPSIIPDPDNFRRRPVRKKKRAAKKKP